MTNVDRLSVEDFVRLRARDGWSKAMVADALELSYNKFVHALLPTLPEIKWGPSHQSPRRLQALASRDTSYLPAVAAIGRAVRYSMFTKYNIGGFVGTLKECYTHWAEYITVSYSQVQRRLRSTENVYEAFFGNCRMHVGWGQNAHILKHYNTIRYSNDKKQVKLAKQALAGRSG